MIDHLPLAERPRERCLAFGAEALSLRECLAVVLGVGPPGQGCLGLAAAIVKQGSGQGEAAHAAGQEEAFLRAWLNAGPALLQTVPGLGPAQKARLLAAFEIGRRLSLLPHEGAPSRTSLNLNILENKAVRSISQAWRAYASEWLGFVPVFADGRVGAFQVVERGTRTAVNVDRRRLFLDILLTGAPAFILLHNHPSGSPQPSEADALLTKEVKLAATQLDLHCLSHLVITAFEACVVDP